METRSVEEGKQPEIDAAEHEEKHRRYEALYSRRLRAKYFSKKAVDGVDIYDRETTIDNEVIKSGGPVQDHLPTQLSTWKNRTIYSVKLKLQTLLNRNRHPKRAVCSVPKDSMIPIESLFIGKLVSCLPWKFSSDQF